MTLLLGLWFSIGVGVGDFYGGYCARRFQAVATVATAMIVGIAVTAVLLVVLSGVVSSEITARDTLLGVLSGSVIGFGLAAMYRGIAESSAAVVTPISAVLAVLLPFGWDLATGGSLAALGVVGAVVAFVGLALTTVSPELGDRVRTGVVWGVIAGLGFGGSLVFLGETGDDAGLYPALVQRTMAFTALFVGAQVRRIPVLVPTDLRVFAALSGLMSATGIAAFTVGAQRGSLAEISAAAALAPAVTASLSARFDGNPFRWWQMIGTGLCVVGVAIVGAA